MPLYALDDENRIIPAQNALNGRRYRCLECKGAMQRRVGLERRAHFYHLHSIRSCRLYSKSIDHLILQTHLQEKNPALIIERPFEKILRIADLCWEEKKIIFEIQCSPISQEEAKMRTDDYSSEGYTIVWLLDCRLYNRRSLRFAESQLRQQACYYFTLKNREIFDQFEVIVDASRIAKGPPLPIDLLQPARLPPQIPSALPRQLKNRETSLFFSGDLLDRSIRYPIYLQRLIEHEETILAHKK